ncbi:Z1 domain-containing protein [Capnocytophaga canis]|uniref:Z1 domain-containing protein n=1 Tax=Capnocytophaga canis TaxID=1848903 RepID=UPI00370DAFF9
MEIQILNSNDKEKFKPVIGDRTTELVSRLKNKLDEDELNSLLSETSDILSHCTNPNLDESQSTTNLVFGYVQSGKTMSFTTLSAMANDNGFKIIVYFAGTKTNLLTQTTKRLKKDLINNGANSKYYKSFENPTLKDVQQITNALQLSTKPTILITVLKHHKYINNLTEIFNSNQIKAILKNNGVLIIDDEADQASLNGFAYKNSKSEEWEDDDYTTTYSSILKLKSSIPNHSYIQYTATPQGPLLISMLDLLSPKYHTVLTPGKKYTGGKTFFVDHTELVLTIPENEVFNSKKNKLENCPKTLIEALQIHLMNVALVVKIWQKEHFLSMMVHADKDQDASETFHGWITDLIQMWTEQITSEENDFAKIDLVNSFKKIYPEVIKFYNPSEDKIPSFEEMLPHLQDVIFDTNIELIISRTKKQGSDKEIDWNGYSSHILVGAEMLNRGFTVENLAVTYMPRYSVSKSTADTIQQRCRFFGYKLNYLKSCRVYLPEDTILEYTEYVQHEEEMRQWLKEKSSIEEVEQLLLITPKLNATRKNILTANTVNTKLKGWRKMNAFQNIEENKVFVENFIKNQSFTNEKDYGTADRNHRYIKLPIQTVIEFLSNFKFSNMPDAARKQATIRYLKYLANKEKSPLQYAYIIQMAYAGDARERAFDENTERLKELHSGRSGTATSNPYPGDSHIKFEDSICIQIHKVKLKSESMKWNGKEAYTLAIYYPKDFAVDYVANEN